MILFKFSSVEPEVKPELTREQKKDALLKLAIRKVADENTASMSESEDLLIEICEDHQFYEEANRLRSDFKHRFQGECVR